MPLAPPRIPASRYVVFLVIASLGCLADLLSKHWIFQWRGMPAQDNVWWLWEGYIGIETALNPGALFGMGASFGPLFAGLSIVAAVGIIVWVFVLRGASDLWLTIALACILGGILGNLYDRLGLWHPPGMPGQWRNEVRDWILLRYGRFTWPNFNIADCLLVCGAGMLMLHAYWQPPETSDETSVGSGKASSAPKAAPASIDDTAVPSQQGPAKPHERLAVRGEKAARTDAPA